MKLKPITILALIVILVSIFWILYQKKTTPKSAEPIQQQMKAAPTPQQTPGRPLKENEKFIAPAGLYVTVPEGMNFRQETADDIQRTMFYIEKSDLSFQMFGVFETSNSMDEQGLEKAKKEMVPDSIKDVSVGGYKGFEGLVTGPKARYVTIIIKDGKPLTISTVPTTPENNALLDQILSTVSFQ